MSGKSTLWLPLLLIILGIGWLLTSLNILPAIDWIWTLGIASVGLLTFVLGGFDKFTMAVGPFFLIMSCLSIMRQTDRMPLNVEVPVLVILAGFLMLVVRHPGIPMPSWMDQLKPPPPANPKQGGVGGA